MAPFSTSASSWALNARPSRVLTKRFQPSARPPAGSPRWRAPKVSLRPRPTARLIRNAAPSFEPSETKIQPRASALVGCFSAPATGAGTSVSRSARSALAASARQRAGRSGTMAVSSASLYSDTSSDWNRYCATTKRAKLAGVSNGAWALTRASSLLCGSLVIWFKRCERRLGRCSVAWVVMAIPWRKKRRLVTRRTGRRLTVKNPHRAA
ncbi:hypothetical protein D3C84_773330 [compost metagenome]